MKLRLALLPLLWFHSILCAQQAAPTNTKPAVPAAKGAKEKAAPTAGLDQLFRIIDLGRPQIGVRYPVLEKGKTTSLIISQRMTKLDENLLELEDAIIDQKNGDNPMKFFLERATYNRLTDQLLSAQPSRIESKDYQIEGDNMAFDRKNNVARLDGRVRMIVYSKKETPAAPAPAAPAAAPTK